ncbi:hypothetical protein DID80_03955 [Candidatus Marinamargulisbacteria bacterium SCGC AAA071-K20]|nr:hypothetical protein DID80_03955 [Candidatus Marinamargulisbacteria bacterium SCGC AAA071-K20]
MFKKCSFLFLFTLFLTSPSFAQINTSEILNKYQDSILLGKEQFFNVVQEQTLMIIDTLQTDTENIPTLDRNEAYSILTASSFYNAYFSIQKVHYETLTLYDQVQILRNILQQIDSSILFLKTKPDLVNKESIGFLFYARGFTKLYLSKQLLNAIVWKQYIVQPTRDIINLVASAEKDLKQSTSHFGIDYDKISKTFFTDNLLLINDSNIKKSKPYGHISKKMKTLIQEPSKLKTFSLIVQVDTPTLVSPKVSELITNHIFKTLYFLNSNRVKSILSRAENFVTYEEITSKENRPLFGVIDQTVELSLPQIQ